jgi:hypothetical protein
MKFDLRPRAPSPGFLFPSVSDRPARAHVAPVGIAGEVHRLRGIAIVGA